MYCVVNVVPEMLPLQHVAPPGTRPRCCIADSNICICDRGRALSKLNEMHAAIRPSVRLSACLFHTRTPNGAF